MRILDGVIVALLVLDALLLFVVEVLFLPSYIGGVAIPITAVLAGVLNTVLVWLTRSVWPRLAGLPVAGWALAFAVCLFNGPGGDLVLLADWRTLLFAACGLIPPLALVYRQANQPLARA